MSLTVMWTDKRWPVFVLLGVTDLWIIAQIIYAVQVQRHHRLRTHFSQSSLSVTSKALNKSISSTRVSLRLRGEPWAK